ncbi:uncharacterized protein LOC116346019 [Contarinia nasturtii]|uniref:uncharacterized protein LOC116346019 n=1 Tax=Contarinia nasturtii TaxID=265458 RepID=UPI0012D39792|nr:uncharacterized protein LOC116346019 [Contarinia nasturtii]
MVASKKDKSKSAASSTTSTVVTRPPARTPHQATTTKTSSSSSSSTSKNVKTTSSSSTTKSTSEKSTVSQLGGQDSSVIISEVHSNIGIDDGTLRGMQTQYVVTQPENVQQPHKPKEHYIFGGTKIVEVGTTMGGGGEQIAREKNQSTWNGKFVYESATPQRTVFKSWTKQSTSTDPSSSTVTTTTTKEEVVKTGGGETALKTDSSKLVHSDTMKRKADTKLTADSKTGIDATDNANATDLLLESERCIAKKAYVCTKDEEKSSTSNIESQILSNTSLFDSSTSNTKNKTTTDTTKTNERYPITTVPSSPSRNVQDSNVTSSSLVQENDASNRYSTEQYSQSFSTSSRTERDSSSNQVIEIVDGKERVVSDTYNEKGSMQLKSSQENYKAKSGTGVTTEVEYDQKNAEENIKFASDKRDKEPIFDRDYHDSHRNIKQSGDNAPIEYLKGSYETTRFDDKTKKYVTDVRHHENNRQLDHSQNVTDSIQSKYDVETSHLNVDNLHGKNKQLKHKTDVKSMLYDTNDHLNTTTNRTDNISSSSTTNDFIRTATSDSIDSKSTTYTSKVFDNKTNTWKVVDESNINEMNKRSTTHKPTTSDDHDHHRRSPTKYTDSTYTSETNKFNIDKNATTTNTSKDTKIIDRKSVNDKHKTVDKISRTTDTKSMTKTIDEKVSSHLYDEKTKTWREVDEKTIKSKRPSLIRYVSKDNDGKFTTIYKRKLFDKRSGTWKVVDEKIYRNNNFNEHIPEVIEDVTNVTTTTYTTKVYDTKTNTWRVVDEQTFTDRNTTVPKDIADEIARDQPDIANITTTTELTKIFDASTNTWKIVNERSHTDFVEKIVETPRETIIIDDITDITKIKSINDRTERTTDITDITDINRIKNTINLHETEENILREVTKENVVNDTLDVVDRSVDRRDDIITTTKLIKDGPRKQPTSDEKKPKPKPTAAENEQCICEICTCGRHRCTHGTTTDSTFIDEKSTIETTTAYRKDFIDNQVTSFDMVRTPMKKPVDHLKPEGDIEFTDKKPYKPAEKVVATKPQDTLYLSGEFNDITTSKTDFTGEQIVERASPIRRNTWTKLEGDLITTTTSQTEFIDHKDTFERTNITQKKTDNLFLDGVTDFKTTSQTDFIDQEIVYQRPRKRTFTKDDYEKFHHQTDDTTFVRTSETIYQPGERPQAVKPQDNLRTNEGDFVRPEKSKYVPAERPQQVRPEDNLRQDGPFYTPEKTEFRPAERPKAVKPQDNLRTDEGDFVRPEKTKFIPAERPQQVRPEDNLRQDGPFYTPEKPEFRPADRPKAVKPQDNLRADEGDFVRPEKQQFVPAERPQQVRPEDNLRQDGPFYTPDKQQYKPVERPKAVKPEDNLRPNEGEFQQPEKQKYVPAEKPKQIKPKDNLTTGVGEFIVHEKTQPRGPAEKRTPIKHDDNLKPGQGKFVTPEKQKYQPVERPKQVKPTDNLKTGQGEFVTREKTKYIPGDRPKQVKPTDNLKTGEGDFVAPEKNKYIPADRPKQVKPTDNLKTGEGDFTVPEKTHPRGPAEKRTPIKHDDNLKTGEGKFITPEKPKYQPVERPKQIKPQDNLKSNEGTFEKPQKPGFKPAERAKPVKPVDNLKTGEGEFEGRRKIDTIQTTKVDRVVVKKHTDQITLNEGRMETDTTSSTTFKKQPVQRNVVEDIVKKQKMRSNITLGDDTTILRTTNQMNYNTITTHKDERVEKQTDVTDTNRLRDGTIAITTMKVTTILENEKDHTPIKEVIRKAGTTNVREEVVRKTTDSDVINRQNIVKEQHHVNEVNQNVVNKRYVVNQRDVNNLQSIESRKIMNQSQITMGDTASTTQRTTTNDTRGPGPHQRPDQLNGTRTNQHQHYTSNIISNDKNVITESITKQTSDTIDRSGSTVHTKTTSRDDTTKQSHQPTDQYPSGSNKNVIVERQVISQTTPAGRQQQHYTYETVENTKNVIGSDSTQSKHVTSQQSERTTQRSSSSSSNTQQTTRMNRGGDTSENVLFEKHTIVTSTPKGVRQQNYSSDILNMNDKRSDSKSMASTSQSDKINNQLHLRQHDTTSTNTMSSSSMATTSTSRYGKSNVHNSTSNISSIIHDDHHQSSTGCPVHRSSITSTERQRRDYVSSSPDQSQTNTQQHHRKNVLTSSTDVNNSVFHRKANLASNSNEALHSNSMSSTAAIQRKSISNLHDQAIYNTSSDRKSYSSMHRQGKETVSQSTTTTTNSNAQHGGTASHSYSSKHVVSGGGGGTNTGNNQLRQSGTERTQKIVTKDNLSSSLGGEFYGKSESKAYGSFTTGHQHHVLDRAVSRRSNQSSISFGDGPSHGSSVYRREYAVVHSGPCPAAHIEKSTFTHTRDTKSHKFFKTNRE